VGINRQLFRCNGLHLRYIAATAPLCFKASPVHLPIVLFHLLKRMGILIVDIMRISAQLWMFSMHAAAMLFMCCTQVMPLPFNTGALHSSDFHLPPSLPLLPSPPSGRHSGPAPGALRLAAAPHQPRPARRRGFFHPVRNAFLQERGWFQPNAATIRIAMHQIYYHSLPSFMAHHDSLHYFAAAVSTRAKQIFRRLDAAVCIQ